MLRDQTAQNPERRAATQNLERHFFLKILCRNPPPRRRWVACVSSFTCELLFDSQKLGVRLCNTLTPGAIRDIRTGLANVTDAIEIMLLSQTYTPTPNCKAPTMPSGEER